MTTVSRTLFRINGHYFDSIRGSAGCFLARYSMNRLIRKRDRPHICAIRGARQVVREPPLSPT
jgi:hypothetical protein